MSTALLEVQNLVKEKNALVAQHVTGTQTPERSRELFLALDEAFKDPELGGRLSAANEKLKKFGVAYNPTIEKTKFVGECTECRTFTEIVARICEDYGCVARNFTTNFESDDCNAFIVNKVNPTADLVTIQQRGQDTVQNIRANNDKTVDCFSVPMLPVNVQEAVRKEALCACMALDAMVLALESINLSVGKAVDRGILYGNINRTTGAYVAIPNFDSIDLLIPASQKRTANNEIDLYRKMIDAISEIQDETGCPIEEIVILMRQGVKTRILGTNDNNDRPIFSELQAMGVDCNTLKIACANAIACQSVRQTKSNGVVTTDVWIGMKRDYAFGTYFAPTTEPTWDFTTNVQYLLQHNRYVGGKLLNTGSFYKITATL